jgi:hypothetical protein
VTNPGDSHIDLINTGLQPGAKAARSTSRFNGLLGRKTVETVFSFTAIVTGLKSGVNGKSYPRESMKWITSSGKQSAQAPR